MDRSPYHLIDTSRASNVQISQPWGKADHFTRSPANRTSSGIEDQVGQAHPPPSGRTCRESNPIVEPRFGTYASRYGTSRSLRTPSSQELGIQYNNHKHPLLSLPYALDTSKSQALPTASTPKQVQKPVSSLSVVLKTLAKLRSFAVKSGTGSTDPQRSFFRNVLVRVVLPGAILAIIAKVGSYPGVSMRRWDRLGERTLGGRQCVMNLFVDKYEPNEFNPDYDPATKKLTSVSIDGTYRSKGQLETIARFISSVAASFRPNVDVQQHVVFAGTRDGGHLALEALQQWPARGSYKTKLHILADHAPDDLQYDTLQDIEDNLEDDKDEVHVYDAFGNRATKGTKEGDDDGVDEVLRSHILESKSIDGHTTLPDLRGVIFDLSEDSDSVIPYFHVDGTSMGNQMEILRKAKTLLQERKIVVVGLEHTQDLDVHMVIEFFRDLDYKTFMLGLRQLTRIDNVCPEMLANVMQHPSLVKSNGRWLSSFVEEESRSSFPPFFVAMPRGRHGREEMSIQHMYDLFSGAANQLQVQTANDRKAAGFK